MNRKNIAGLALAAVVAVGLTFGVVSTVTGQPPDFVGSVTLDQDMQLCLGDTVNLTANYTANKDVTKKQWYVNGVAQGLVENIPDGEKQAGSDTFAFTPTETGVFTISFRVWHHQHEAERNAREEVIVTIVDCTEEQDCPAAPAIAGAYLKDVKGLRPNDPLYSEIIQEIAHVMHEEFGNDPCAPGYADDVEAYIDSHWMFD
jgi:hypothetical protein